MKWISSQLCRYFSCGIALLFLIPSSLHKGAAAPPPSASDPGVSAIANPILFVTQVPMVADFTAVASVFGNHQTEMDLVGRGGDLWIRYPDGSRKNLTETAGYGTAGLQGANSIAVRQPSVHWSGTKALFSMVIGSPPQQYQYITTYWQIYEITGLGASETPVITRVPNQPWNFNNVSPFYGTDERILFTSDRPRGGERHLYPQLDEYEEAPTVTGLYSLDPKTGNLTLLNHTVSGVFNPTLDSFGRIIFTRWDHLERDQQADTDYLNGNGFTGNVYPGTFNYSSEAATATRLADRSETFPEPRTARPDLLTGTNLNGHGFNEFLPWQIDEDGSEEETINHVGRHELLNYFNRVFSDDPALLEFIPSASRPNQNSINNILEIKEDPTSPGRYFAIDAPEFSTHAAGQVISFLGSPGLSADQMAITYWTDRSTSGFVADNAYPAPPSNTGHYRDPLPLSDGTIVVVHTAETRADLNSGSRANPISRYDFRLKTLVQSGSVWVAGPLLTSGIVKSVTYYDPDVLVTYSNQTLWELDPVEVRARLKPARRNAPLDPIEQGVFNQEGVDVNAFRAYLRANKLALIVSRNVTTRDKADTQQPFNLKVFGSATQTVGSAGKLYEVAHLQLFQADQIRGIGGVTTPRDGRRPLAQILHDPKVKNPPNPAGPAGSVRIASDGSMAAFMPAHRATTWQLSDNAGTPVVRERFWLTFQPGEIRLCTSCHGLNATNQANQPVPTNEPLALHQILQFWKSLPPPGNPAQLAFYPLVPCRILDTRNPAGPLGGPALAAGATRNFLLMGTCGVPLTARTVSTNVTVVPSATGQLRLYGSNLSAPTASTISFQAGRTRANNAQITLATDGTGTISIVDNAPGPVDVILDVNGYYE